MFKYFSLATTEALDKSKYSSKIYILKILMKDVKGLNFAKLTTNFFKKSLKKLQEKEVTYFFCFQSPKGCYMGKIKQTLNTV